VKPGSMWADDQGSHLPRRVHEALEGGGSRLPGCARLTGGPRLGGPRQAFGIVREQGGDAYGQHLRHGEGQLGVQGRQVQQIVRQQKETAALLAPQGPHLCVPWP